MIIYLLGFLHDMVAIVMHVNVSGCSVSQRVTGMAWTAVVWMLLTAAMVTSEQREAQPQDIQGVKLVTHPLCEADIHRLCSGDNSIALNENTSNLDVMSCILDQQDEEDSGVSAPCHHVLWQLRHNMTRSSSLERAVNTLCADQKFAGCRSQHEPPGHYVSCVLEQLDDVEDEGCADFLESVATMVFSDYRLIYKFAEECSSDIARLQCGRLEEADETQHSQGKTIECLSQQAEQLGDSCKLQVLRVAELQAEDYHMDRPLYFACREDRERFCASTVAGNGLVYQCLLKHKMEQEMSKKCRQQLRRRQKLASTDYKVSKRLREACAAELQGSGCEKRADTGAAHHVRLGLVLLCLDNYHKQGNAVNGECLAETVDQRRSLMEDYTLSPELITACQDDIGHLCSDQEQLGNGRVIHCLMMHANQAKLSEEQHISAQCQRQVEDLLRVVDVGANWKVDPVLQQACAPVVREACSDTGQAEGAVLNCLAETLDSDAMTLECETVLLQIQFFISRDFKLDPQLYKTCHEDAVRLCHASEDWWQQKQQVGASTDPLVLPCLYRNAFHRTGEQTSGTEQVSEMCQSAVRRVMRYRSGAVDLHPEVEAECISDLAKHCSERTVERRHEITCLQHNYEDLESGCQRAVKSLTQDEARYVDLHPVIAKVCKGAIKQNCMHLMQSGGVFECLVQHKNQPDIHYGNKCRAAITHFQLIALKDYSFSYQLRQRCEKDVKNLCDDQRHTKAAVISCLSSNMLNDTLSGHSHRVSKPCQKEVQAQLFARSENEALDPRLNAACGEDIHTHCRPQSENKGSGKVLECLRDHVDELRPSCSRLLFRRQQQSLILPSADYFLSQACRAMILKYCSGTERSGAQLLDCLKSQQEEPSFEPGCRRAVQRRLSEQKRDYRLHPALRSACLQPAQQHCSALLQQQTADQALQGQMTACLLDAFRQGLIDGECGRQLDQVMREADSDVRQHPGLQRDCSAEIGRLCGQVPPQRVPECLRQQLVDGATLSDKCAQRVARLVEDVNVDVHSDPQLSAACALDLQRECSHVPAGHGAQFACLEGLRNPTQRCADVLTVRKKMMAAAAKVRPVETVAELYASVRDSPQQQYLVLLAGAMLATIFCGGLCCGRVTKRAKYIHKIK